jgi:thymidylate kinase
MTEPETDTVFENGSAIVVLEGPIGVGKSTATSWLQTIALASNRFDEVVVIPEPIKKAVLDDYIRDMKSGNKKMRAWSFQMNTAVKRLHDYAQAKQLALSRKRRLVVIDRGLYGNEAFARMQCKRKLFDADDLYLYEVEIGVHDGSLKRLQNDARFQVFYLRCTPETAWRRTLARGDKEEVGGYDMAYMRDLFEAHEEILANKNVTIVDYELDDILEKGGMVGATNAYKILELIKQKK